MLRIPAVERVIGCRVEDLTEADLQRLVDAALPETEHLDFKQAVPDNDELAKDICAFANGGGGVLLCGIAEDGQGQAKQLTPIDRPTGDLRLKYRSMISSRVRPGPAFDVRWIDSGGGATGYLVLAVAASNDAPHAILRSPTGGDHSMSFPIRRGTGTEYLSEPELASRYERRFRFVGDRQTKAEAMIHAIADPSANDASTQLAVVAVPLNPGAMTIGGELQERLRRIPLLDQLTTRSFGVDPQLRPGATKFVQRGVKFDLPDGTVTFFADGSMSASSILTVPFGGVVGYERHTQQPAVVELNWLSIRVAGLLAFACDVASEEAGCAGDLLVCLRLSSRTTQGTDRSLAAVGQEGHPGSQLGFLCGDLAAQGPIRSSSFVGIETVSGRTSRSTVQEFQRVLSDVTQALGVASPLGLAASGEIDPSQWVFAQRDQQVRSWAQQFDLLTIA